MALNSSTVAAGDVTLASQYNNARKDIVYNAGDYATATGSANTYAVTLDGQITAYSAGLKIRVKINVDNTSASTINVNSLGAKTIKKNAGAADVAAGDLQQDGIYDFVYDGTNFQVQALAISGLPSVASQGDILYYNGSSWVTLVAGTSGQVLKTNGAAANPSWSSAPPSCVPWDLTGMASQDGNFAFTDDFKFIPFAVATGSIALHAGGIGPNMVRWINGSQQQVARTTVWASAGTGYRGAIVIGGQLYWLLVDGSSNYRLYMCATNTHIGTGGNWTQITLSGTNLASTSSKQLIGYNGTEFIFTDSTSNFFIKATISGTTLTEQSTFTATGAAYGFPAVAVSSGIYFQASTNPKIRFCNYSGTLDTDKQAATKSSTSVVAVENAAYADLLAVATFNQYGNTYSLLP